MRNMTICAAALLGVFVPAVAGALIVEVGPFLGALQEDFEQPVLPDGTWQMYPDHYVLPIMGGAATVTNEQLFLWAVGGATGGDAGITVPAHGRQGLGENMSGGTVTLTFVDPVCRFGGWWQPYMPPDPAQLSFSFFDVGGAYLGTREYEFSLHGGQMDWHGWVFEGARVKTVTWLETGGQIDYLQGDVPEPGPVFLLGTGLIGLALIAMRRRG